jgi:hypothetical protein
MCATRYIIFSLARCGSTSLARLLNALDPCGCAIEPFSAEFEDGRYLKLAAGNGLGNSLSEIWRHYRGIKHVWHPLGWPFATGSHTNDELLLTPACKLLLLYRKNILKRVVSQEIALQTGIWHADSKEKIHKRLGHKFVQLDHRNIQAYLRHESMSLEHKRVLLRQAARPWIEVSFESLFGNDKENVKLWQLNEIIEFLEIVPQQGCPTINDAFGRFLKDEVEQKSDAVYKSVPGIEEINEKFGTKETGYLFGKEADVGPNYGRRR